jgi:hypothetical protein
LFQDWCKLADNIIIQVAWIVQIVPDSKKHCK